MSNEQNNGGGGSNQAGQGGQPAAPPPPPPAPPPRVNPIGEGRAGVQIGIRTAAEYLNRPPREQ